MKQDHILIVSTKSLIPFIFTFGLYVQLHGDFGPGGGFQAGVIFAAGAVLFALVFGLRRARRAFPPRILEIMVAFGVLFYGGVGIASMIRGAHFLDYDVLAAHPIHGQHLGILLVELGVGLTVTAAMLILFFLIAGRGVRGPSRQP